MEIPKFSGTQRKKAQQIADWVYKNIQLVPQEPAEVVKSAFSRPVQDILNKKNVCFNRPCIDISAVAAEAFRQNGFPTWVALEKKIHKNGEQSFHLSVEFLIDRNPFHLWVTRTEIRVRKGRRQKKTYRPVVKRVKIERSIKSKPLLSVFNIHSREDLSRELNGLDWSRLDRFFARSSSKKELRKVRRKRKVMALVNRLFRRLR